VISHRDHHIIQRDSGDRSL